MICVMINVLELDGIGALTSGKGAYVQRRSFAGWNWSAMEMFMGSVRLLALCQGRKKLMGFVYVSL